MLVRLRLFVSSFAPLFVVAAVRFESRNLRVACAVIALLGVATLLMLLRSSTNEVSPRHATPTAIRDLGSDVAAYVASYILPFVAVEEPTALDLVGYGIVLVVLAVVFVNSDLIGVNPVLYLMRYRVYSAEGARVDRYGDDREALMISRRRPRVNQRVAVADVSEGVLIVVDPKPEGK
jgi:hypothetical protein